MDEGIKLAFEFARDLTNQLITLSTGVLAFTVTFSKDVTKTLPRRTLWLLGASWSCYLVSIAFGILTTMALTGTLLDTIDKERPLQGNVLWPARIQIVMFLIATLLTIVYGVALGLRTFGSNGPSAIEQTQPLAEARSICPPAAGG